MFVLFYNGRFYTENYIGIGTTKDINCATKFKQEDKAQHAVGYWRKHIGVKSDFKIITLKQALEILKKDK